MCNPVLMTIAWYIFWQARLDDRLLDLFPPHKRTLAELESHFMVRPPNPFTLLLSPVPLTGCGTVRCGLLAAVSRATLVLLPPVRG